MPSGYIAPALLEPRTPDYNYSELPSGVLVPNAYAPDVEVAPAVVQPNIFVRALGSESVILSGSGFTISAVTNRQAGDELWTFINHNKGFSNPIYETSGNWSKFLGSSAAGCDVWRRIATGDSQDDFVVGFNSGVVVASKMAALGVSDSAKAAGYDFPSIQMLGRFLYDTPSTTWYLWGTGTSDWMPQDNTADPYSFVMLNTWQHRSLTGVQNLTLDDSPPYNMDEHIWDFTAYFDGEVMGAMMGVVSFDYEPVATSYQNYRILYTPSNEFFYRTGRGWRLRLTFTPP
jgi:hypothetical protein